VKCLVVRYNITSSQSLKWEPPVSHDRKTVHQTNTNMHHWKSGYWQSEEMSSLHLHGSSGLTLKMKLLQSLATSKATPPTTQWHIPKDLNPQWQCCEYLKSCTQTFVPFFPYVIVPFIISTISVQWTSKLVIIYTCTLTTLFWNYVYQSNIERYEYYM